MRFEVKICEPAATRTGMVIVPVFQGKKPGRTADTLDAACDGLIARLIKLGRFRAQTGETMLIPGHAKLPCEEILLVGLGDPQKFSRKAFRRAAEAALQTVAKSGCTQAVSFLGLESFADADSCRVARIQIEAWFQCSYRFTAMKSEISDPAPGLKSLTIAVADKKSVALARQGVAQGQALAAGQALARDLGNLPPNVCTPSYLAQEAKRVAKGHPAMKVEVFGETEMRKLGMGALLSVTAGAVEPAKFIIIRYNGGPKNQAPVVLVGKGITFDTGGISLKPPPAMDEMKFDMSGAGSVIGTLHAVAKIKLRKNVIGVIPTCENMPSGSATRPGDIVTTMSGLTVEILNTDAEGRLILCDALTYSRRFKPAAIIDIATLTGACVIALGKHRSGLLANSDKLADALLAAGEAADDPAWRLPLGEEYMEQLNSNFADMANVGGRDAGTITAACYLSRFTEGLNWAHLDIAGTATKTGPAKGSTGRPVPLLLEFLLNN